MREEVEGAGCRAHFAGGDPQIASGSRKTAVTQQQLDGANIGPGFQQVHRKRVTHRMRADGFADAGEPASPLARVFDRARGDRLTGDVAIEQPSPGPHHSPVATQSFQQLGREHHIAIFLTLALHDANDHAPAIDVGGLQTDGLGDAQAGSVARGQDRSVLGVSYAAEKLKYFLGAQDDGQLLWLLWRWMTSSNVQSFLRETL